MAKATMPATNQVRYEIGRPFNAEGFFRLNVLDALTEVGYSKTEGRRLFRDGAVKIWDTKLTEDGNHFAWYKRLSEECELVEADDTFILGGKKLLFIRAKPVNPIKKLWWNIRPYIERYITDKLEWSW